MALQGLNSHVYVPLCWFHHGMLNVHITRVGLIVSISISVTDIEDAFNQDLVTIASHSTHFKR
jgi:hypothetical protein